MHCVQSQYTFLSQFLGFCFQGYVCMKQRFLMLSLTNSCFSIFVFGCGGLFILSIQEACKLVRGGDTRDQRGGNLKVNGIFLGLMILAQYKILQKPSSIKSNWVLGQFFPKQHFNTSKNELLMTVHCQAVQYWVLSVFSQNYILVDSAELNS